MHQPPNEDPKKQRKPAPRPRHHIPGGSTGSPEHALRRLDEAERLERALLHELAGLLDGSTRFLRLALRELKSDQFNAIGAAAAINHLGAAESALNTMAQMVDRSREAANDRQHPTYMVAPQPVHTAIDAAVAHNQYLAAEHGVQIAIDIEVSALKCPPLPLYPIVSNAIRNAVEAHASELGEPPKGHDRYIRIHARSDEGNTPVLILEISDNGPGLCEELAADPQLALSLGYSNRPHGSGVGLSLCADIVASLGGTLSIRPGASRGAIIQARIPYEPASRSPAQED
jgi:two-component system, OmpR family, sensor histidine kinase TctE